MCSVKLFFSLTRPISLWMEVCESPSVRFAGAQLLGVPTDSSVGGSCTGHCHLPSATAFGSGSLCTLSSRSEASHLSPFWMQGILGTPASLWEIFLCISLKFISLLQPVFNKEMLQEGVSPVFTLANTSMKALSELWLHPLWVPSLCLCSLSPQLASCFSCAT